MGYKAKNQGKKCLTMNIMIRALEIIELLNGENPIETVVLAVQNAAVREDKAKVGRSSMPTQPLLMFPHTALSTRRYTIFVLAPAKQPDATLVKFMNSWPMSS